MIPFDLNNNFGMFTANSLLQSSIEGGGKNSTINELHNFMQSKMQEEK